MTEKDWGKKRICLSCGAKFYDFGKAKPVCPLCGAEFDIKSIIGKKSKIQPLPVSEEVSVEENIDIEDFDEVDIALEVEDSDENEPEQDSEIEEKD